ncbi:MAG: conjugal transfer protein TraC, partial [Methyloglobulus sp.]|nr:conjugal transfer protein TraC [Methyloglobulus sp.]
MGAFVYEKQFKRHTLRELIPVESYDDETHLFTTSDGYIGFGFVSKPLPGCDESVTQRLNVLFSFDYPKESFIQVMLMGSQDISQTLDNIRQLRVTKDKALVESMDNRLKMLVEGSNHAMSMHARSFVREFKLVFTIKIPLQQKSQLPASQEISVIRDLRLSVEQTLKSAGFAAHTLDADLYLRVLGQLLHWGPSANWRSATPYYDPAAPINEQVSESDDMMQTGPNGVWLGDKRLRILSPVRLPAQMSLQSMRRMIGDPLTG